MQYSMHELNPLTSAKSPRQVESHTNRVFEVIKAAIVSGELRPNQRLVESSIAKELGVSRTPVREALMQLELSDYISKLSKGGWIVTDHSPDKIRNLYEVREALEVMAIKLACQRATKEQIDRANDVHKLIVDVARNRETDKFIQLNSEFHAHLFEACGNEQLSSFIENLRDQYFDRRLVRFFTNREWDAVITQHGRMLKAVSEKKSRLAEKAVIKHIATGRRVALLRL